MTHIKGPRIFALKSNFLLRSLNNVSFAFEKGVMQPCPGSVQAGINIGG